MSERKPSDPERRLDAAVDALEACMSSGGTVRLDARNVTLLLRSLLRVQAILPPLANAIVQQGSGDYDEVYREIREATDRARDAMAATADWAEDALQSLQSDAK